MNEKTPTPEQIAAIDAQTPETLAEWWCVLNTWEWPEGLPGAETAEVRHAAAYARSRGEPSESRDWAVMMAIHDRVGHKACLYRWNTRSGHMTSDEATRFVETNEMPQRLRGGA